MPKSFCETNKLAQDQMVLIKVQNLSTIYELEFAEYVEFVMKKENVDPLEKSNIIQREIFARVSINEGDSRAKYNFSTLKYDFEPL